MIMDIAMTSIYNSLLSHNLPSPCFVTDTAKLRANAAILEDVQRRSGARILLALKAFSQWNVFDLLSKAHNGPLYGSAASSPDEARLGKECFGGETHGFAAGYSERDVCEMLMYCDHLVFNSFSQWKRFSSVVSEHNRHAKKKAEIGIRVNPEHSEGAVRIYNPCAADSRLGVRLAHFEPDAFDGISGLHMHTLFQQGADAFERTLAVFEKSFGKWLHGMTWLNLGGGHHITRRGYDIDLLCGHLVRLKDTYNVQVYLEPGEAVALDAGVFISTVLDVVQADMPVVILDCSATCHMPDVLEMPYHPEVIGAAEAKEKNWTCRLAGKSCLTGDIIGEYSFDQPLEVGDRVIFTDMAIYSMVKTTTFNGIRLPSIAVWDSRTDWIGPVRDFSYVDFMERLS
jgi:carboxynorspermidine decarboxylase